MRRNRRHKSAFRLLALMSIAPLALTVLPAAAQAAPRSAIQLEAQSLSSALTRLGRQTRTEIIFNPALVRGKHAAALRGSYSVVEAIDRLIAGHGLRARPTSSGAFVIEAQAAPAARPQETSAAEPLATDDEPADEGAEVVVTGTLLRGVAPTGTNVVSVRREEVIATGASSANDLLASIPQVGNFGTVPSGSGDISIPIVRPNIRNLGASGGTTTLVLMNGKRLVGAGVLQTSADPSIIPPDMIERVEVVPDGGSAIYGSDAIGGVINFITRKRFDGIGANARYGFADDYETVEGNLTVGKDWGTGSIYASYAYAWHDNILGIDRDYVRADQTSRGGQDFRSTTCALGNFTPLPAGVSHAAPALLPNTQNRCDATDYDDIYPREERHAVFAGLTQALSDSIDFQATAYWSRRDTIRLNETPGFTGVITFANPYFRPIGFSPAQSVAMSFASVFGESMESRARFDSWGVSPSLSIGLGEGWELRTEANYGHSFSQVREPTINATAATIALAGTTLATALNPYDPAASNPAVLAAIRDFENYGHADQEMFQARAILDGRLATIAGGDIRLAIGAEYFFEELDSLVSLDRRGVFDNAMGSVTNRNVKSVFAEALIPLVGAGNAMPGLRAFQISGSIRHDSYDDVGGTTNPKIGFNYKPFDDLLIRGNYGTSFHAPSLADTTSLADARVQILLFSPFRAPGSPSGDFARPTLILAGGNPTLKPEEAKTWSIGFDWTPATVPGLVASATYFNVEFTDAISVPPFLLPVLYTDPGYRSFYTIDPTLEQVRALVGDTPLNGAASLESLYVGTSPYVLMDARRTNLGAIHVDGIDFNLAYLRETGFGSVTASIAGTYTLNRKTQAVEGNPFTDNLKDGTGRLAFVASLGAKVGDFTARASLNHRGGYPTLGAAPQTHVDAFNTVDLFFAYDLGGLLKDSMLTVNVDNVFDQDPPYLNSAIGYTNGFTLGRLVSFGVRTKF